MQRIMKRLSNQHKKLAQEFSSLSRNDYVQIDKNATVKDVFNSMEKLVHSGPVETPDYTKKYQSKLEEKAKAEGFVSVEKMLLTKKLLKMEEERLLEKEREKEALELKRKQEEEAIDSTHDETEKTYKKNLNEILNLEKIKELPKDQIHKLWNLYHSGRECISASMDVIIFDKLMKRGKNNPMFILPLPREDGYEMFFLQFQGKQIYFTTLQEYQLKREGARPAFSITFYDELREKDLILMLGECTNQMNTKDAQNLVYQLQLFYILGNEEQLALVDQFTNQPQSFDYQKQIQLLHDLK